MSTDREFKCRSISEGIADGEVVVSRDAVCFYLVEYATGIVVEKPHDLLGKSIAGKVLVMPSGKGSSVVQADGLYKLMKNGKAPAAMIVAQPDTVLVSGAIVMDLPLVDSVDPEFYAVVEEGDHVFVDAVNEKLVVRKGGAASDEGED